MVKAMKTIQELQEIKKSGKTISFEIHSNKKVKLNIYLQGWRMVKANKDREFKESLRGWWPCTGAEICKQFTAGVHERINMRGKR